MKRSGCCPKCDSTEVIDGVTPIDRGDLDIARPQAFAAYERPGAVLRRGRFAEVTACVCANCGFTELYVAEPRDLLGPGRPSSQESRS